MTTPPLHELVDKLPRVPFTGFDLDWVGLSRPDLRRLLRADLVRRVLVNAYVRHDVPDSIELRAQCLGLVCGPHAVVVDRTAAWLWGIDVREDWDAPTRRSSTSSYVAAASASRGRRPLAASAT